MPIAAPVVAVSAGMAIFWGWILPVATRDLPKTFGPLARWDLETYFLPKFVYGSAEFLGGVLPIWNPFEFAGYPLAAAAQPAALYLPKIALFGWLEPTLALQLFLVLHYVLAAATFALLGRSLALPTLGITVGAVFYCFSMTMLGSVGHPVKISNLAWTPLVFLMVDQWGSHRRATALAFLVLVLAIQLTAGYPAFVIDTAPLLAVFALGRWVEGRWTVPPWKSIPVIAAAFAASALVAGIQVFPLAELVGISGRLENASEIAAMEGPRSSLELLLLFHTGFVALYGFVLAGIRRHSVAVVGVLFACLFLVLGGWKLLRLLPIYSSIRIPASYPYLMQLPLALLAAEGVRRGMSGEGRARQMIRLGGLLWALACLLVPLAFDRSWGVELGRAMQIASPSAGTLLHMGLGAGGGLMLAAAWRSRATGAAWVAAAVCLLAVGQLSSYPSLRPIWPLPPLPGPSRSLQLVPPEVLAEGRVFSLYDARGGFHLLDRIENTSGREGSLPPLRYRDVERRLGLVVGTLHADWEAVASSPGYLDTLDVAFLVVPRPWEKTFLDAGFQPTRDGSQPGPWTALRNPGRIGRAWVVHGVHAVDEPAQALDALLAPDFDARSQVILEKPTRHTHPFRSSRPARAVPVVYGSPTEVRIEVALEEPGILVLADSCFPGWLARIDGVDEPVHCGNYLVRAVELDAGPHVVEFLYRPWSVRWGLASTGFSGILLVGVLVHPWLRRRREA